MLTASFAAAGAGFSGMALASGGGSTGSAVASGLGSLVGGNQVSAPVSGPASVCGNTAAALGDSAAGCEGTAGATAGSAAGHTFADTPETGTAPSQPGAGAPARGATAATGSTRATGASGDRAVPATTLAADSASGMSNISIYSLAIGALVAGAVALKMAGRRFRGQIRGHRV